jgi:hypothetical protein
MQPRVEFGRRAERALRQRSEASETPAVVKKPNRLSDEQRKSLRIVLWATPLIAVLVAGPILLTKLPGVDCSQKPPGQRGIFDINWCQAGMAAVQGAARGVSGGYGTRPTR